MMLLPQRLAHHARWSLLTALVVLLGACGEAHVVQREPDYRAPTHAVPAPRHAGVGEIEIVRGDTLYGVAFRNGMDFRELAAINGIEAPYTIYVGQILKLRGEHARVPTPARPVVQAPSHPVRVVPSPMPTPAQHPTPRSPPAASTAASAALPPVPTPFESVPPELTPRNVAQTASPTPLAPTATQPAPMQPVPTSPVRTPPTQTHVDPVSPPISVQPAATPPLPVQHIAPAPPMVQTPSAAIIPADVATVGGVHWRWPAKGALLDRFMAGDATRQGIDIAGNAGEPVLAASDGVVVYSGSGLVGYGELIIIKHSDEWLSAYGHNRKRLVQEGQRVKGGQPIAEMGSSGAPRDELHFEIRRNGRPVDPQQYLPAR